MEIHVELMCISYFAHWHQHLCSDIGILHALKLILISPSLNLITRWRLCLVISLLGIPENRFSTLSVKLLRSYACTHKCSKFWHCFSFNGMAYHSFYNCTQNVSNLKLLYPIGPCNLYGTTIVVLNCIQNILSFWNQNSVEIGFYANDHLMENITYVQVLVTCRIHLVFQSK